MFAYIFPSFKLTPLVVYVLCFVPRLPSEARVERVQVSFPMLAQDKELTLGAEVPHQLAL